MNVSNLLNTLFFGTAFLVSRLSADDANVAVGQSIQDAVNLVSKSGGGVVYLSIGVHEITKAIKMYSGTSLIGGGAELTTIKTNKIIKSIEQGSEGMTDVTIKDLTIKGIPIDGSHAIHFVSFQKDHRNILLSGVHAFNTGWGVHIKGAKGVKIQNCVFSKNGAKGKEKFAHNLYLRRCENVVVANSEMNDSMSGNGCNISYSENILIFNCVAENNYFRGFRAADTDGFKVENCRINGNGDIGLIANREKVSTKNICFRNNVVFDNAEGGIQAKDGITGEISKCRSYENKKFDYELSKTISLYANSNIKLHNPIHTVVE